MKKIKKNNNNKKNKKKKKKMGVGWVVEFFVAIFVDPLFDTFHVFFYTARI